MSTSPSQLFLLADHIKLSLLERQRAISLNLEPNSQDGHISRSLESMREGIEAVEKERTKLEQSIDPSSITLKDQENRLRSQYDDLVSQFRGFPTSTASASISHPNNPSLAPDFAHASFTPQRPRNPSSSSFLKKSPTGSTTNGSKSVRFSDTPLISDTDDAAREALFPSSYRDDPDAPPDHSHLDNQQIHVYHSQVLQNQDEQLDRLGESIGRQRELSIQIGDELDSHVQLLDEVDEHMDRHQTRIDGARKRLGIVARKAKDNIQLTIILVLIVILVLLIIILKT
ncbi:hypothetical protein FGG08_000417 [Glutinoglossum americanum]|uniref:t-SNARE coiled-coil homology domain-containing protein n=1 Tax=Glutinoglossum americanum TaxID=1670608 RepID=A0A9P8IFK7_9PEZI|nr:hypothetical protein FGG08_000417 [Glutinoglossum americanum]